MDSQVSPLEILVQGRNLKPEGFFKKKKSTPGDSDIGDSSLVAPKLLH